jgi:phosphocarrier protein
MVSFEYVIKDVHGIHARPATDLFKMTKNYQSVVKVAKGDKEVPFKGVMGIMSLGAKQGDSVKFTFEGAEADALCEEVKAFMEANL